MDERTGPDAVPVRRVEITDSRGFQTGNNNVQVNVEGAGQPTGPLVAGEIPQEPLAFQPRENLLAALRSAGPGLAVVAALTGMRGVGKTQVAAAFAAGDAGYEAFLLGGAEGFGYGVAGVAGFGG